MVNQIQILVNLVILRVSYVMVQGLINVLNVKEVIIWTPHWILVI